MTNSQFPIPNEFPMTKDRAMGTGRGIGHWTFGFGHSLVIGHWSLVIPR